ncbi:MAG: RpoL/Rpb11 RNA polymerase subunit family protein [Candidatus Pacearchaeota archaeon]
MEIKVLKSSKDELEFHVDNVTIAELLRVFLNKDSSVSFAAWKREHPSEKPIVNVKTKGKTPKKAIKDAIASSIKELEKTDKDFSGMK